MLVVLLMSVVGSAQAAEHPVIDATVGTAKRVVKFPLALVSTTLGAASNLLWNNPVAEAWNNTK